MATNSRAGTDQSRSASTEPPVRVACPQVLGLPATAFLDHQQGNVSWMEQPRHALANVQESCITGGSFTQYAIIPCSVSGALYPKLLYVEE